MVMIQDTHILDDVRCADARAVAAGAGWHLTTEAAIPSQGTVVGAHYNIGGVAIAVRNVVSMRRLRMSEELAGRAAAAELLYPGVLGGRITVVTLYLQTGMRDGDPTESCSRTWGLS